MPPPSKPLQLVPPPSPHVDEEGYVDDIDDLLEEDDDENDDEDDIFDEDDEDANTFSAEPATVSPSAATPADPSVQPAAVARVPPGPPRRLVAQWTKDNGVPRVAWFVGNKRTEDWRAPTRVEWDKLKKARVVRGGVGEAVTTVAEEKPWKKWLIWGGGAVGVGLAGWWMYKTFVARDADADVEDVDG